MKPIILSAWIAGVLAVCAAPARAQSLGQFGGAEVVPVNGQAFGAYVDASAHVVGVISQLRLSFYPKVDFGFQGGLDRLDYLDVNRTVVRLGTDFKVLTAKAGPTFPVDLAFGAGLAVETGDNVSVLTVGPMGVVSRSFPAGAGGTIVPYGALGISYSSIDVPGRDDTGLQLPLKLGTEFRFAPELRFVVELQQKMGTSYSDKGSFAIGATFPF